MFGIEKYTTMIAACLQYCVLCFICSEQKQINHLSSVQCDRAIQLWQVPSILAGDFFSYCVFRPVLLASCESVKPVSVRHLGCIGPVRERERGSWNLSEPRRSTDLFCVYGTWPVLSCKLIRFPIQEWCPGRDDTVKNWSTAHLCFSGFHRLHHSKTEVVDRGQRRGVYFCLLGEGGFTF